jgi:hypothetical protein
MQTSLSNFYQVNMSAIKMGSKGAPGHNDQDGDTLVGRNQGDGMEPTHWM